VTEALPWITSAVGITIIYLAGRARTRRLAWALGILNQGAWVTYALSAKAYGFIIGSAVYGAMYLRNLLKGD